jgi:hypothetical protein
MDIPQLQFKDTSYLNICNGVSLRCMYEQREEHGISNEKYGSVDTDQVPDSIIRIEFYSKAIDVSVRRNYFCVNK